MTVAGLGAPWADVPRVEYVIWQYRGYAASTRERLQLFISAPGRRYLSRIATRALQFLRLVEHEAWTSTPIYNDGFTLVFRVEGGFPEKWRW